MVQRAAARPDHVPRDRAGEHRVARLRLAGLDLDARPSLDEVLAVRDEQAAQLHAYVDRVSADDFTREVEVLENGTVPLIECLYTVFEQSFEHHRYAVRDLVQLEP